jgi:signal transduction histidine kinase
VRSSTASTERYGVASLAPYGASLVVALGVLLSIVASGRIAERKRLEDRFAAVARAQVARLAADFDSHVDQLGEDARLLAELAWQTGEDPQYAPEVRKKVLRDGVRALSSAVEYCRGVAFSKDGHNSDVALDPTEDGSITAWLRDQAHQAHAQQQNGPHLLGPLAAPGDRSFFVLAERLPFGAVAAAIDTRRFFEFLQHRRPAESRVLLVDANETLWTGCSAIATCRAISRTEWQQDPALRGLLAHRVQGTDEVAAPTEMRGVLQVPTTSSMALSWQAVETAQTTVSIGLLTSLSEIQTFRQATWWRLLATGAATLLSTAIVVFVLWRQSQHERMLRERLQHAEDLNRLEHQLVRAEKLATVGVLTAGLAHELGTPLAIIRGRAEILEEKTRWPEIRTILEQSDHISSTLRQVLDFSREQSVELRPTDVLADFQSAFALLDFRLRQKRIQHRTEPSEGSFVIAADPDQFQQVLANLILNACDACAPGGTIVLRASVDAKEPGQVRIDVIDDGCGIPETKLDAVFDPFFTTKPKGEGTGLGLPVAAGIVRNHQGKISIASREGNGTTVTVFWPADRNSSEASHG